MRTRLPKTPAVREDRLCAVCEEPLTLPARRQKGISEATYLKEPFCSNACARKYFGTEIEHPRGTI